MRARIQEAIDMGLSNPDPAIRAFWQSIPRQGECPSPEEVICILQERVLAAREDE